MNRLLKRAAPLLKASGLCFSFGSRPILRDVELEINCGKIAAIWGSNGSGKSTLLKLVAGLVQPESGVVELSKEAVVGYVPQDPFAGLFPWFTSRRNIEFVSRGKPFTESAELLDQVGFANDDLKKRPGELSGGMRERLALIAALVGGANCLLLDEPFSDQDFHSRQALATFLRCRIAEEGVAGCAMITHDPETAILIADEVLVLRSEPDGAHLASCIPVSLPDRTEGALSSDEGVRLLAAIIEATHAASVFSQREEGQRS